MDNLDWFLGPSAHQGDEVAGCKTLRLNPDDWSIETHLSSVLD